MEEAIDEALAWGEGRGLHFSGPKTLAVLFTHKRIFRKPPPLKVGNTELPYSNNVRHLGVELDSKLSLKRHAHEKIKIVKFKLMHVRRAIGKLGDPCRKKPGGPTPQL